MHFVIASKCINKSLITNSQYDANRHFMMFLILIITYEGQQGFMNHPFSKFKEDIKSFKY